MEGPKDPLFGKLKAIDDNAFFALGRYFGKFGLVPKDVLIKCPKEEEYAEMPTLKFKFGQTEFTLGPKEYIMPIVLPKLPIFGNLGVFNWCHSMIRPKPTSGMFAVHILPEGNKDTWILGQLLFNKVCVEFNYTNREIGVALVKKEGLKN